MNVSTICAIFLLLSSACGAPPRARQPTVLRAPLPPPEATIESPGERAPRACQPRPVETKSSSSRGAAFSQLVQNALKVDYAERVPDEPSDGDPTPESARKNLVFVVLREDASPVPWTETTVPGLERFVGPVSLYLTELWTGELEYPRVSTLVAARELNDRLELHTVVSPSFSGDTGAIAALLVGACAPSEAARVELTRLAATLYALGDATRVSGGSRDGSCMVAEFHLYDDPWRTIAVTFDDSGIARHVYAFNPMDDDDSSTRASVCGGSATGRRPDAAKGESFELGAETFESVLEG